MSQELKIRYSDVEDAISKIESASEAFETSLLKDMASGNKLDIVNKLNKLNQLLDEVGQEYKKVLKENNQSVIQSVQSLKEADKSISSSIKAR
jgi:NurA-like 5'-3' nuclease